MPEHSASWHALLATRSVGLRTVRDGDQGTQPVAIRLRDPDHATSPRSCRRRCAEATQSGSFSDSPIVTASQSAGWICSSSPIATGATHSL